MISRITDKQVEAVKRMYPAGCRVQLLEMNDPQAPPVGCLGTVMMVDDCATIHVNWDNGSTLGVVYGMDRVEKVGDNK